ncbi:ACP S-malonyltransferase [Desulfobacterota bacterium AH_259_B03_O07]|nr:ACP S-malonyltransferase [Desulfobacterota bacterium AH_259_B03_O07]
MNAFVFPGQGAQYVGMGLELYKAFDIARKTFDEANNILGFDLTKLCFEDSSDELRLTANAQPAILTVSVAALRVLLEETDIEADYVAGHSLGEYTALVAGGAIEFGDAVWIVRKRGEYTQSAVPLGLGSMSAIIGLQKEEVQDICTKISSNRSIVCAANFNAPGQTVISGNKVAVDKASAMAKSMGAKRVIALEVSAPFHSSLMAPAAEKLSKDLERIKFSELKLPVVTNIEAQINMDSTKIMNILIEQVKRPVRWYESMNLLYTIGVRKFFEIGPGKTLGGLIKRTVSDPSIYNLENIKQLAILRENES